MIVKTTKTINGVEYDYTYSDAGVMIERNGARYSEALDPLNSSRLYTETDEPIETVTEATEADYQAALRDMGVDV
jgi:Tat protein secretion system quality control protein TatD with DNase activity